MSLQGPINDFVDCLVRKQVVPACFWDLSSNNHSPLPDHGNKSVVVCPVKLTDKQIVYFIELSAQPTHPSIEER
jgi:hypothetical protein